MVMERRRKLGARVDAAIGGCEIADFKTDNSHRAECKSCAQVDGDHIPKKQRYPRLRDLDNALVVGVKEREMWPIPIIGVTQHFALPRISA